MTTVRSGDTATLLANGEVLAAGGASNTSTFASAELYNPATGQWALTGSMNAPREAQTATLLPNGQVLAAGGSGNSNALSSAELYTPATGKWTLTGSMSTPRNGQEATLLPDGDVLVTAGVETSGSFSEFYTPATGQWSPATGGLSACTLAADCRFDSSATLLGTGNVLVAGGLIGTSSNPSSTAGAILYNPATNAWTATGPMNTGRFDQTTNLLADGQVLAAGGRSFAKHAATLLTSAELYTP